MRRTLKRRFVIGVLAMAFAGVAAPAAFAHNSGLGGSATCNTATGMYDITWTVGPTDYFSYTPKISASNRNAIPVDTALTSQYKSFTESVAGNTTSVNASITVKWTRDNYTRSYSKTITLPGTCTAPKKDPSVATIIHNSAHSEVLTVVKGTTVHDSAVVSGSYGTPSGNVTFQWFTNGSCSGNPLLTSGTFSLSNGSVDGTSFTQTPSAAGSYAFRAVYGGDATYNGTTGPCEPLTVTNMPDPVVTTTIHNSSHADMGTSAQQGTTVHDSAVVSGTNGTPTGTVTFRWFTNSQCSGDAVAFSNAFQLSGGTVDGTSFTQTPGVGSFAFQAVYSGDSVYNGITGPCEPLTVTSTPPPPPPPNPPTPPTPPTPPKLTPPTVVDVTVAKTATARVQLPAGSGSRPIVYGIVVTNNGPSAAADVKVADSAPVGVTFVSATTSGGTCTTTAQALDCTIPSLASGSSVSITLNATVASTGTKVNDVFVTTTTTETNPNNNTAQARTLVTKPGTPPTAKPNPSICSTIIVSPKMLKASGKTQRILVKVRKGKNASSRVRVRATGPGIDKTVRTGKNGSVVVRFKAAKPGIVRVALVGTKACNSQRLGVVGTFEPPVTG